MKSPTKTTKKTVYRLLRVAVDLHEGDEWKSIEGWNHVLRMGLTFHSVFYRRRCTPREAALARRLGLV